MPTRINVQELNIARWCRNPNLGLVTRQGFTKVWAKSEAWESHFVLLGM
jgi:hypothetical protein